jgi:hypothetical protein
MDADLVMLREMWDALPSKHYRWRTDQGRIFLLALADAVSEYQAPACAAALSLTSAGVRGLLQRQLPRNLTPYPSQEELRPLLRAWRAVQLADRSGRSIARSDPLYVPIHEAVTRAAGTYDIQVLASAMRERPRRIERFLAPPISNRHRTHR